MTLNWPNRSLKQGGPMHCNQPVSLLFRSHGWSVTQYIGKHGSFDSSVEKVGHLVSKANRVGGGDPALSP